jgi:hypothetical protein
MRKFFKNEWLAVIWMLAINLLLALVVLTVDWFLPGEIPEGVEFLSVAIVVSLTAALFATKNDIVARIEKQLDIYRLLESIEDDELREIGEEKLQLCKRQLAELSRGVISGPSTDLLELLARKIRNANHIKVSHVAITPDEVHGWKTTPTANNYYQSNLRLLKTGKSVERVFVLRRRSFIDKKTGAFDSLTREIIEGQENDGIKIYIVWEENIADRNLWEDFVIIDNELVYINEPTGTVFAGGWRTLIKKNKQDIELYRKKYNALVSNYGQSLVEALAVRREEAQYNHLAETPD